MNDDKLLISTSVFNVTSDFILLLLPQYEIVLYLFPKQWKTQCLRRDIIVEVADVHKKESHGISTLPHRSLASEAVLFFWVHSLTTREQCMCYVRIKAQVQ